MKKIWRVSEKNKPGYLDKNIKYYALRCDEYKTIFYPVKIFHLLKANYCALYR